MNFLPFSSPSSISICEYSIPKHICCLSSSKLTYESSKLIFIVVCLSFTVNGSHNSVNVLVTPKCNSVQ